MSIIAYNQAQCAFLQHRTGTLDADVFEARMVSFESFLEENPLARQAWAAYARKHYAAAFVDFVEGRVEGLYPNSA
jgi:hypothetical protein